MPSCYECTAVLTRPQDGTHAFANRVGSDVAEVGDGPGSYNIRKTVWHVNCCNPEIDNGWDVFQAILGWQNTGTYGSVISYNVYWLFIVLVIVALLYEETGHLPLKRQATALALHVPGLRMYIRKKKELRQVNNEEVVQRAQERLANAVQTEVTPSKVESAK